MCISYPSEPSRSARPPGILTNDPRMRALISRATLVARSNAAVLLVGETGVGKELFAEHVHRMSPRAGGPFVAISLSAIPTDLVESELFGHERGAFTSAHGDKKGLFELAHGGTVFLDDIDDVSTATQAKLLRVLETERIQRIGATASIRVDVRLVTASKVDLPALIERDLFRSDLYYRINVCPLYIPPLRNRAGDIPLLVDHFLRRFTPEKLPLVAGDAATALSSYPWPGNVRELRNVIQRVALFADGDINVSDLPPEIAWHTRPGQVVHRCVECWTTMGRPYSEVMDCLERQLLTHAIVEAGGNTSKAARALGLSLSTVRDKMRRHRIDVVGQKPHA